MIFLSSFKHSTRGENFPAQDLCLAWASVWKRKCVIFLGKFKHSSSYPTFHFAESSLSVSLSMEEEMCDFP